MKERPLNLNGVEDLYGKRSQLWSRDNVDYSDKVVFSALQLTAGLVCDAITKVLNEVHIENHDVFTSVYDKRDRNALYGENTGLLTAGNHSHYVDDPVFVAAFLKFRYLNAARILIGDDSEYQNWHWMPAAKENFFHHKNPALRYLFSRFFGYTKTVPIARKGTIKDKSFHPIEQTSFVRLIELLNNGDWVNYFPEGTRAFEHGVLNPFQKGIGKLAVHSPNAIFLPFGHDGMEQVSPRGAKMEVRDPKTGELLNNFLRTRQRIQIVFGKEPIVLRDLVSGIPQNENSYNEVKEFIREEVEKCSVKAKELNAERRVVI